ncbi:MAG: hypothetical protein C4523_04310 [Myxococcales bacterium]|nr:MAG: hypothetical protein C4523_04310 [Myxococcales bacterium]
MDRIVAVDATGHINQMRRGQLDQIGCYLSCIAIYAHQLIPGNIANHKSRAGSSKTSTFGRRRIKGVKDFESLRQRMLVVAGLVIVPVAAFSSEAGAFETDQTFQALAFGVARLSFVSDLGDVNTGG